MKFKVLTILLFAFCFLFSFSSAFAIGVGVKPSVLELEPKIGQFEKTKILVYNISQEAGVFQVFPDELNKWIKIEPNNFRLEAGETKEVNITILAKEDGRKTTNISVLAKPLDRRSFGASSGIKIPLRLNVKEGKSIFSASILGAISPNWIWVLVGILAILLLGFFMVKYFKRQKIVMKTLFKIIILIAVLIVVFLGGQYLLKILPNIEKDGGLQETEKEIKVSLLLDFGGENTKNFEDIRLTEGKTIFDLLKKVTEENNLEFTFKQYSGVGVFIESIDNFANNPENDKWWQYWVNDEYAQVAADKLFLKNGDIIKWKHVEGQF